ncbi:FtsX-like permease family protein [Anaerolineae bacterium CFX9]|nr:FtsX-like permease family protein [Anaerolineae bacterium CFX9]
MFTRFAFYLRYAWRNLRRSARWTTFAVFCIAAGVATVVALRALGLAIGDSLVDNVRSNNHGDITFSLANTSNPLAGISPFGSVRETYTAVELSRVETWARENNATVALYSRVANVQLAPVGSTTAGRPQFISTFLIDPQTFPPTGDIFAQDPAGVPLSALFTGDRQVVISRNLAEQSNIRVGDTVHISGSDDPFTVVGIVATETEAGVSNLFASFFGFAYLNVAEAAALDLPPEPNTISIVLPEGADIEAAAQRLRALGVSGRYDTVPELLERNQTIGDLLGRFIVIMGLGALLIGGVGIINTMLVMVGRRSTEIAALKTFGLKGRQVAALFLAEAFLLGLMGSVVGSVIGLGLSALVNQYGEAFLQQGLRFRIYPEAIAYGLGLGIIVTLVFGVLPVLVANKVRPASILRPNETQIPAAGCLQSLIALLLVIFVIGGVAGQILGSFIIGVIGVAVTLLILGLLVCILWVIVWLVSKLPSFGVVDMRLAFRNLTSRRVRTATTLLALSAGMFALSSITFVGAGTRELLQFQLTQNFGGNVLVFPLINFVSENVGQGLLNLALNGVDGIEYRTEISFHSASLSSIDGYEVAANLPQEVIDAMPSRSRRFLTRINLQSRISDNPQFSANVVSGRYITPEDQGRPVIVVGQGTLDRFSVIDQNGNLVPASQVARVGSTMMLQFDGPREVPFEIIGIVQESTGFGQDSFYIPTGASPDRSDFTLTVLQVPPERLNETLVQLSNIPLALSLDISFIDGLLRRLIDQFAAIPTLVGLLSLLAAAVTMANTVSLATLERRRQIGVLKAVGLKSRRVLTVMLLENMVIGLLGGILGIGLSALGVAIMTAAGQGEAIPIPRDAAPVAIALVIASVVIAVVSTVLSARPVTAEPVTSVLRYE